MSAAPRQYETIVAMLAANVVADDAIRAKQDAHEAVEVKHRDAGRTITAKHEAENLRHREAGRVLDAKHDALRMELQANSAKARALQAEKVARVAANNREPIYQTGEQ